MAVAREFIPDATEGSAPGLTIKSQPCRSVTSESGESTHSMALTSLSKLGLDNEGIPIAQKIDKKFNYIDAKGNLMSKEEALKKAGGIVYYQDEYDPSKGRLRQRGAFVKVDKARTIASRTRASNCSDIANLRDLEEYEGLPSVSEDTEGIDQGVQDEEKGEEVLLDKRTGRPALACFIWMILLALLAMAASTDSTHPVAADAKLIQSLDPELPWLLAKHGIAKCGDDGKEYDCKGVSATGSIVDRLGSTIRLSGPLSEMLAKDEMSAGADEDGGLQYFLDVPLRTVFSEPSLESRKASAEAEVDRILASHTVSEILGEGPRSERRRAFNRIVRLLHPDKGLVAPDNARAALALRLAFAARRVSTD